MFLTSLSWSTYTYKNQNKERPSTMSLFIRQANFISPIARRDITQIINKANKRYFSNSSVSNESSLITTITSFPKTNPFAFQLLVATGKTSAADIVVQIVAEKKKFDEIDWKRNGIFVVFGFAYLYVLVNAF